jgi:AcrR family transcriptional regulator
MTPPRTYRSSLRDDQARATRRRIVEAGRYLFVERGYGPTTIDAIAERAGVGRKTVFTSVGGKATVLKLAFDWTLAGDDEPIAIADRPEVRQMMEHDPADVLLAKWMAMNAVIAARLVAIYRVLVVAADGDPEVAVLLETLDQQRIGGARVVMSRIAELGGLRPGLEVEQAAAIADLLIDPTPYQRLVVLNGWSAEAYTAFIQQQAASAILGPPRRRR